MTRALGLVPAIALATALFGGAADAQTIKIGVNEPLTGAFAASGTYVVNGAKIAADEINAKGGILGKKIELVIEDNKSNPTEAAAVAEKLITSDKVDATPGPAGTILERRNSQSFEPIGQPFQINPASRSPHHPQRSVESGSGNTSSLDASASVPSATITAVASACVSSSWPFGCNNQSTVTE